MNFKEGKWAKKIIELQHDDGSWGYFHTLSNPRPNQPMTTEQALRRLEVLGFTIEDKPVKKAVNYLNDCLTGKNRIPDREEKTHNWNVYVELMLSTWIRIFTDKNAAANKAASKWNEIITASFASGRYDHAAFIGKQESVFNTKINPKAGRHVDFVHFYTVSLLTNSLDEKTEKLFFKYILNHDAGIYYIYSGKLNVVPESFVSKKTTSYLRAIELLAKYKNPECKKQLRFVSKWLKENATGKNRWDMGKQSKDGINLPLSDSWKTAESRISDCTHRITGLLAMLGN